MQEAGAREADLEERRLHAGQHARDAALVQVADQPAPAGTLDDHLLQGALVEQRGARLARRDVDQYFHAHRIASARGRDCNSRAVSYRGSPITPE